MPDSKYAAKQTKAVVSPAGHHHRRVCDGCHRPLAGARGHGFPTLNGRGINCSICSFGAKKPTIHTPA